MIGTTISHYRILDKIGEGGMGVVYKAEDTRLNRTVALKFLPDRLTDHENDKARFLLEAQAAASLSHQNICTIYGIEEEAGKRFIAMEFVDGQNLHQKRGTITLARAIDIGVQIADGLAAAHEKGIVHRDIKPENIMIRKDGVVQIMDFGLAKLWASRASRLTKEGSTVGTAGFMSPEQVQGQQTDHRSDIFSLGVLLYELFTGELPFKGVHETALLYEIVNVDPRPLSAVKPEIDPELDRIVLECLEKEPSERYQSAAEISKDLKRFKRASGRERASRMTSARPVQQTVSPASPAAPYTWRPRLPWIVALLSLALSVALGVLYVGRPQTEMQVLRTSLLAPEKSMYDVQGGGHVALSPDRKMIAFVATDSTGRNHLCVRALSSLSAQVLPGTDNAMYPFWSPDSKLLGFFADGKMKKTGADGGPPLTICDAIGGRGASWNKDDIIVFAPDQFGELYSISAAGGTPVPVTSLDSTRHEQTHRWPQFLPDGKHFLYYARCSVGGVVQNEGDAVYVASLDRSVNKPLLPVHSNVEYSDGYLLFVRERTLMAQPFDPGKLELRGEATPIAGPLEYDAAFTSAVFSAAPRGLLVYAPSAAQTGYNLIWCDRRGKESVLTTDPGLYYNSMMSHDGKRIATQYFDPQSRNFDIWLIDLTSEIRTRFTFNPAVESYPVWSPDDAKIAFVSDRRGHGDIYVKSANGAANEELVFESPLNKQLWDWSPDGKDLLFSATDAKTKSDLWVMPLTGERKPFPYLQTEFNETQAHFSPDGKWVAYVSDESGTPEIYVRPFPGPGGKWQLSTGGGVQPRWRRDGKEICYFSMDSKVVAVQVSRAGSTFEVGTRTQLFDMQSKGLSSLHDISHDGQWFLFRVAPGGTTSLPLTLITNWEEELKKQ